MVISVKMIAMVVMSSSVLRGQPALMYQLQDLGQSVLRVLLVILETPKNATVSNDCVYVQGQQCVQCYS